MHTYMQYIQCIYIYIYMHCIAVSLGRHQFMISVRALQMACVIEKLKAPLCVLRTNKAKGAYVGFGVITN